jgi:hypothetical protein
MTFSGISTHSAHTYCGRQKSLYLATVDSTHQNLGSKITYTPRHLFHALLNFPHPCSRAGAMIACYIYRHWPIIAGKFSNYFLSFDAKKYRAK